MKKEEEEEKKTKRDWVKVSSADPIDEALKDNIRIRKTNKEYELTVHFVQSKNKKKNQQIYLKTMAWDV